MLLSAEMLPPPCPHTYQGALWKQRQMPAMGHPEYVIPLIQNRSVQILDMC